MNIFRLLGDLLVIYIIYKLVFDFIVPLYTTTKQMKGKIGDMSAKMQQQQRAQAERENQHKKEMAVRQTKISSDDYIDYEEIKN